MALRSDISKKQKIFFVLLLCVVAFVKLSASLHAPNPNPPVLSSQRQTHILYGDKTGGGHLHGTGAPCKSEFPADWTADEVLQNINKVAANDNARWNQQRNGYHVTEKVVDGIKVRVVLDENKRQIITAYPTNTPRNPCPIKDQTPANDNRPQPTE